jgi:hypothetical protein
VTLVPRGVLVLLFALPAVAARADLDEVAARWEVAADAGVAIRRTAAETPAHERTGAALALALAIAHRTGHGALLRLEHSRSVALLWGDSYGVSWLDLAYQYRGGDADAWGTHGSVSLFGGPSAMWSRLRGEASRDPDDGGFHGGGLGLVLGVSVRVHHRPGSLFELTLTYHEGWDLGGSRVPRQRTVAVLIGVGGGHRILRR